jgi:hypothetical protein
LSEAQQAAVGAGQDPARFLGQKLDAYTKESVANDPRLQGINITPQGKAGPDFWMPDEAGGEGQWWDITTQRQWSAHLNSYEEDYGWGTGIFYK